MERSNSSNTTAPTTVNGIGGQQFFIRAISIDFLSTHSRIDIERLCYQDLPHLNSLRLGHPYTGHNVFNVAILIGDYYYWHFIGDDSSIRGAGQTAVNYKLGYLL